MARADVIVSDAGTNMRNGTQSSCLVKTPSGVLYWVYIDTGQNVYWKKSTDDGITWSDPVAVTASVVAQNISVWYDKWTPGNTGTLIHIAYIEANADDVLYRSLDTNGDTLGTQTTIFAGASTGSAINACVSITRAIGGNLYCMFDIDAGTETGFYRSVDVGANWTSRDNTGGAEGGDYFLMFPGFAADTQDTICIFWDRSANEISRKLNDDSANSWAETSIAGSMTSIAASTCTPQFSATVDDANNKILLVAWSNRDTVNADLRFWSIDESAITEETNVVLNSSDDQQMCAIGLATDTSTIYVFYGGKSDGTETAGTAINIYYKTSSDNGASWGSETQLTNVARNFDALYAAPNFTEDISVVYLSQQAAATDIFLGTYVIPTAGGGGGLAIPVLSGSIVH